MDAYISDYRLKELWQEYIRNTPGDREFFKSQYGCGHGIVRIQRVTTGVAIMSNGEDSKLFGVMTCNNAWSCPVCSAKVMARYAGQIACAIDLCDKWFNEYGFMMTFCVPHIAKYRCEQTYKILDQTWKLFYHHGNKVGSNRNDVFSQFNAEMNCVRRIRVCEFTWGRNGWHPHFHCIFFVPKHKLQQVADWQQRFAERWLQCAKLASKKLFKQTTMKHPEKFVDHVFNHAKQDATSMAHISMTETGKVARAMLSDYICGWGADKELTGNYRKEASHKGHYTPFQMIQMAYDAKQKNDPAAEKWLSLYREYAKTTFKKPRMRMTRGMQKLIEDWRQTNDYIESLKKKFIENQAKGAAAKPWKMVIWFTSEQWYSILSSKIKVSDLLVMAKDVDGKKIIEDFLLEHNIDVRGNPEHMQKQLIESLYIKSVA